MRRATVDDTETLVELMAEFYAESGYVLDRRHAAAAFSALLADPRLGLVWIIEQRPAVAGYVVVTFVFGIEYGGPMAVVDDFYVRPAFRNAGLGTAALAQVRESCVAAGARAMSVEVAADNPAAQAVYRHGGFVMTDRRLMAAPLAAPSHEV